VDTSLGNDKQAVTEEEEEPNIVTNPGMLRGARMRAVRL
jgi:hypothetical protein